MTTGKCDCCDHSKELADICEQADKLRDTLNALKSCARKAFEKDAASLGFELDMRGDPAERFEFDNPEPWHEYQDRNTGHRWAGFLSYCFMTANGDA